MNTGLEGRVALVCGAPAGIGYAILGRWREMAWRCR